MSFERLDRSRLEFLLAYFYQACVLLASFYTIIEYFVFNKHH